MHHRKQKGFLSACLGNVDLNNGKRGALQAPAAPQGSVLVLFPRARGGGARLRVEQKPVRGLQRGCARSREGLGEHRLLARPELLGRRSGAAKDWPFQQVPG